MRSAFVYYHVRLLPVIVDLFGDITVHAKAATKLFVGDIASFAPDFNTSDINRLDKVTSH